MEPCLDFANVSIGISALYVFAMNTVLESSKADSKACEDFGRISARPEPWSRSHIGYQYDSPDFYQGDVDDIDSNDDGARQDRSAVGTQVRDQVFAEVIEYLDS
ncbi:hypothetical protein PtB15_1B268 [Puccinia triticina]|nr:hypothetical protein PtB15_1B268 [Puccinia triticina]